MEFSKHLIGSLQFATVPYPNSREFTMILFNSKAWNAYYIKYRNTTDLQFLQPKH